MHAGKNPNNAGRVNVFCKLLSELWREKKSSEFEDFRERVQLTKYDKGKSENSPENYAPFSAFLCPKIGNGYGLSQKLSVLT